MHAHTERFQEALQTTPGEAELNEHRWITRYDKKQTKRKNLVLKRIFNIQTEEEEKWEETR